MTRFLYTRHPHVRTRAANVPDAGKRLREQRFISFTHVARLSMSLAMIFAFALAALWIVGAAHANGGPFVVVSPNGDPSARGDVARVELDLMPHRETRLRVRKEDLTIRFNEGSRASRPPGVYGDVTAAYTIENPTDKSITVDFGFPILRSNRRYSRAFNATVTFGGKKIQCDYVTIPMIYGVIRQQAHKTITRALVKDPKLNKLVKAARQSDQSAREKIITYLCNTKGWNRRDAALMAVFPIIDKPTPLDSSHDRSAWPLNPRIAFAHIQMPLAAIGEQKVTQYYAQLASCLDPKAANTYERIFAAWGGDVRERSVDMKTGKARPRELSADLRDRDRSNRTVYARVDYLSTYPGMTEAEKSACKEILKNLPVVFTFAPMDLLHYRVTFPAKSTKVLSVNYSQRAYTDTRDAKSYQLAYVLHPASLWKYFGPINLEILVPAGIPIRASVPYRSAGKKTMPMFISSARPNDLKESCDVYRSILKNKSGELYVAIDATSWDKVLGKIR